MDVSIIIPIYNVAPYVRECMESVISQTFDGTLECIIVDDCGSDNSMDIVEEVIADYNGYINFVVLHHEHNKGVSAARNTGLDNARGDYVFFLDSDDTVSDDCIQLLHTTAKNNVGCQMVQAQTASIPSYAPNPFEKTFKQSRAVSNEEVRLCFFERRTMAESAWNNLLKRQILIDNSIYFKDGRKGEDQLWLFFLLKHIEYVCFINKITYHYRRRVDSISNNMESESRLGFIKSIGENYHDFLTNLTPKNEKHELNFYCYSFSYYYVRYVKKIPDYEDIFILYKTLAEQYKYRYVKLKLMIAHFLGKFKNGWWILMMLRLIRHPISMTKKVFKTLSPKNEFTRKFWITS